MRIFTASLATETNTFSPVPTDLQSFKQGAYFGAGEHPPTPTLCSSPILILRERGEQEGFTVIEGSASWAEPAGLIRKDVFELLRDEILDQLQAALPVDGVIFGLHGAMVAQGYDDCEGDLLERTRALVGADVLIASEFDPHSHLTEKRVKNLDIAAAFQEFPHTDFYERGEHLVDLALRTLRGEIVPRISTFDCRMIDIYPTSQEPMRSFVDRIRALEGKDDILSISLIHGFMAGDVPAMGTHILVVSNNDQERGDALAKRLGLALYALRGKTSMLILPYKEGIEQVLKISTHSTHSKALPVTIADTWDNPGGGCSGDGTHILRALLETNVNKIAVASIWDPIAVSFCFAAGQGAQLQLRMGGKTSPLSGEPIDAQIEVRSLEEDGWQSFGKSRVSLGRAVVVRIVNTLVDIVLISSRTQTYEPNILTNLGIDIVDKEVLLVKSTNHFYAGFEPVSSRIIHVSAPSTYPVNPRTTQYKKLKRDLWPRCDDPLQQDEVNLSAN